MRKQILIIPVLLLIAILKASAQSDTIKKVPAAETDKALWYAETMPEFPGGEQKFAEYLQKNIKYPSEARAKGIQGKVFISMIVGKDGKIRDIKVVKPVNPLIDAEAVRVIREMPEWIPGKQNGKPVSINMTDPLNFTLGNRE